MMRYLQQLWTLTNQHARKALDRVSTFLWRKIEQLIALENK
ncbi:hypothetical protein [Deinococcus sp. KNUC1210]|nr:hypothetical protein [Deinococcus sp. KNUC1210]